MQRVSLHIATFGALSALLLGLATPAEAARIVSGSSGGLTWQAESRIIGQTPTSDVLAPSNTTGGGNSIYFPTANKAGTVALIMTYADSSRFICSGSVVGGGGSIATAAHCVSGGGGAAAQGLVNTTAYFFGGDPNVRTFQSGGVEIGVSDYFVHPDYTGEVIDQNDIAILRLADLAPSWATSYDLHTTNDLTGHDFNVAGYGTRSTVGGAEGTTTPFGARTGYLREGDNTYDYAWGDSRFQGFFTDRDSNGENFFGTADVEFSFISDFDNGLRAQDASRRIANAIGLGALGNTFFDDTGLGAREVGIAGGDSGGPGFIDGKLASINSYGLTFGASFGDFGGGLNAGWGEFSGYVPIFIHTDFINASIGAPMAVPEPATWAMMIIGFGAVGSMIRRRRAVVA